MLARLRRSSTRERLFAALAAAAVAAAVCAIAAFRKDAAVPLFAAPLAADQLAQVTDTLAAWNVSYTAAPDNVRVDPVKRGDLLLRLSLAGVPHAHIASRAETLAKASALTPQAVIDAEAADGLAGDIAAGLRGVSGVREARVIIAPAKPAVFGDETGREPSASVRLTLDPGAALEPRVADGVRAYVAASVPGLDPKRVALLDDRASPLSGPEEAAGEAAQEQASLQSALDAAFGAGAAIVRVHADYDAQSHQVRDVKRTPLAGEPIVRTAHDERYSSERKTYAKSDSAEDRGSDVRDERTDVPPGRLARLSIAVAVDRARGIDLTKLRALACASVGFDPARGDSIDVEEVDFAAAPPASGNTARDLAALAAAVLPPLAAAAGMTAALIALGKPMLSLGEAAVSRARIGRAAKTVAGYAPSQVRGALEGEPPHTAAAIISALPAATATAVLELYPPEERAAIVGRMARAASPVVPNVESVLQRA
jgi:flagellar M-ring protein FliF